LKITRNKTTTTVEEIELTFPIYQKLKTNDNSNPAIECYKILNETYELIYSKSYNSYSLNKIYYDINVLNESYFTDNDNFEVVKTKKAFNDLIVDIKTELGI
jgi:hypothetical protein